MLGGRSRLYPYLCLIGVDAENLLTDGGNLARPITRQSMHLGSGVRRAFGKLVTERLRKVVHRRKYNEQVDEEDGRSIAAASQMVSSLLFRADLDFRSSLSPP